RERARARRMDAPHLGPPWLRGPRAAGAARPEARLAARRLPRERPREGGHGAHLLRRRRGPRGGADGDGGGGRAQGGRGGGGGRRESGGLWTPEEIAARMEPGQILLAE